MEMYILRSGKKAEMPNGVQTDSGALFPNTPSGLHLFKPPLRTAQPLAFLGALRPPWGELYAFSFPVRLLASGCLSEGQYIFQTCRRTKVEKK